MVRKLIESWNGGKKAFFSALAGALIGALPVAVAVGEYKGKVDEMDKKLSIHLDSYTPSIGADCQKTKTQVAVQQAEIDALKDEIRREMAKIQSQNEIIIRQTKRAK